MALTLKPVHPARGAHWLRDGLRLYLRRPIAFTGLFVMFLFVAIFVGLVPLVGGVLQIMLIPLLSLGLMVASQSALLEGPVRMSQFVEPFQGSAQRRRALLLLCVLYGLAGAAVLWLSDVVADGGFTRAIELMRQQSPPKGEIDALLAQRPMVAGTLFGLFGLTAISVPFWHALALVHWGGQGAWQSLFSSTLAVWRSRGAFVVYGLAWFAISGAFAIVSAALIGLFSLGQFGSVLMTVSLLFLSTLFYVSLIFTFNDSFGGS